MHWHIYHSQLARSQVGCRAARDLQAGIVEAKSSTAKADTSGTGFGVSPVTVADFTVQCLLLGALAQRFPNERSALGTLTLTLLQDPTTTHNPESSGQQDRFIAEETSAHLLAADAATRAAVVAAAARYSGGGGADGVYSELFEGVGMGSEAEACAPPGTGPMCTPCARHVQCACHMYVCACTGMCVHVHVCMRAPGAPRSTWG